MLGIAYSFPASANLSVDASFQYTFRGEKFDYQLGDRLDGGIAASWRIIGGPDRYPQLSLVAEATVRHIEKSKEHGISSPDTGGTAVFLSPGLRVRFNQNISLGAGIQFPVIQELNGNQVETRFRVSSSLSFYF
jgi:hypothetical protein